MRGPVRSISRIFVVIGVTAVVAIAGLAVYLVQFGSLGPAMPKTTTGNPNIHAGSVDLSKLQTSKVQTSQGLAFQVVPLNLTMNYNFSSYTHNGAEFAIPEYVILNYSWTSTGSVSHRVDLGITLGGGAPCEGSAERGSIFADVTHIVTILAEAYFPAASIAGTFAYSFELTKFPLVTTIVNDGVPVTNPAREETPSSLCVPSTQVIRPIFTYLLVAPAISGYEFQEWSGTGPGSYSGPSANLTITIAGNVTEVAQYT